jgi:hypothetical protein
MSGSVPLHDPRGQGVVVAVVGVIVAGVTLRLPPLDDRQLGALEIVLAGVREVDFEGVREQLQALVLEPKPVWLPPPLLTVVAGLTTLVVAANDGLWELGEDVWDKYVPDARPTGRSSGGTRTTPCTPGPAWPAASGWTWPDKKPSGTFRSGRSPSMSSSCSPSSPPPNPAPPRAPSATSSST